MSAEECRYFFCYSHEDLKFVLRLAKEVRAAGANVWLDQLDVLGGEHWDRAVEKALKSCRGMIVVLSPKAVASDMVMDEVSYALDEGKLVVPALLRSCDIPLRLRRLHYIDFAADYETGFSQLLRALGIEQPAQPLESAAIQGPVVQDSIAPLETEKAESKSQTAKMVNPKPIWFHRRGFRLATMLLLTIIFITILVQIRGPKVEPAWTWIGGSHKVNVPGVYGTKGVPEQANVPGGRYGSAYWIDADCNLWVFGGIGYDSEGNRGILADLWKYDGSDWTWVNGPDSINEAGTDGGKNVADMENVPVGRHGAVSWVDTSGNLCLFGGSIHDWTSLVSGQLNDLWKYDGISWIRVTESDCQSGVYGNKGIADSVNLPSARWGSIYCTDANHNLWLFGGHGFDSEGRVGLLGDLWKYDGSNWTWVGGWRKNAEHQLPHYGQLGVAESSNLPGARHEGVSWVDSNGNMWLFGGFGVGKSGALGNLSDLWRYDGTNWTWMGGSEFAWASGLYGSKGVASSSYFPSSRQNATACLDTDGNLWLFGGKALDPKADKAWTYKYMNDLWSYDGTNWTWVSGSKTLDQAGMYGIKDAASKTNTCGSRCASISWFDSTGNLCLFAGDGYGASNRGLMNDMWKFEINSIINKE